MINRIFLSLGMIISLLMLLSCAPLSSQATGGDPAGNEKLAGAPKELVPAAQAEQDTVLPVRYLKPTYLIKDKGLQDEEGAEEDIMIQVGADITSSRPLPLQDIIKRLVSLKNMNVSWASDVNQALLVDVDIRAGDDFFKAIDNLLRQVDYYHEVNDNTIVVKYKETRKFHIAMPFLASTFNTGVGGNVMGGTTEGNVEGTVRLSSTDNKFDIWANIQSNLDKVLEIWESTAAQPSQASSSSVINEPSTEAAQPVATQSSGSSKGYYTIDRPIGLITVTAPRPLLEKIANYLDNLKSELYRQISIEAKILEVELTDNSTTGIDWSGLVDSLSITGNIALSGAGQIYPTGAGIDTITLTTPIAFSAIINAIATKGTTNVLANPKISVMNGQPAMLSFGENVTYIDQVTSETDAGVTTYTVTTARVMSGIGLGVVASIMENDEIVLSMTPVTSVLKGGVVNNTTFGTGNAMVVGLPVIKVREMNTMVRIKSGDMLVVGGLIDSSDDDTNDKVPLLGDIPLVGKLFGNRAKTKSRKELIVLLKPTII